ncbi:TetR/AcrR family transcriptional regulator [Acidianus manzaensis]|uniref:HTH tetR-type domain-containing protein n=1 Tax=Acidianus manzaensis TaxID=282676 RepID=A0A1W6JYJ9_9CREN|nr:TetR/AcrR family transcriptional regulator [Acidianus manzaensis]ARM75312.1 hypothetical protein B6F84_04200 [Acidianus manzaensis]
MKDEKSESTKEKIINAALQVFAEEDFFKASIDEICKRAGVSKGIVFWHFKSKDNLILEIAKRSLPLDIMENCLSKEDNVLQCIGNDFLEKYKDDNMRKLFLHTISAMSVYLEIGEEIRKICDTTVRKISVKIFKNDNYENIIKIRSFMGGLICNVINPLDISKEKYIESLITTIFK